MSASITALVNQMVLKWERRRWARQWKGEGPPPQQPVVTISRSYGAGRGVKVAQMVAERLQCECFDREIVEEIAAQTGVRERVVEALDERVIDKITKYITSEFERGGLTESEYLRHLSRTVLAIGQHGRAVILGHGAHYLLDPAQTLRVRLYGPLEKRVKLMAGDRGISVKEARRLILEEDAQRAAYCRTHFNRDIADPEGYDLLLDFTTFAVELCADLVVRAFQARFGDPE